MFNRFTEKARKAIVYAKEEARHFNHDYIGTEHMLLGLIRDSDSIAVVILKYLGLDVENIRIEVKKLMQPVSQAPVISDIPFTEGSKKALELSASEARALNNNYIGPEHLLLGLFIENRGIAFQALKSLGVTIENLMNSVLRVFESDPQKTNLATIQTTNDLGTTRSFLNFFTLIEIMQKRVEELESRVKKLER